MHVLVSGPQGRRNHVRSALKGAGFTIVDEDNPHGHPHGNTMEWTGAGALLPADIAALDDEAPGHGKCVGDLVAETGEWIPVEPKGAVCFLCVELDHDRAMDVASPVVEEHDWVIRQHWVKPPDPPKPSIAESLARLNIDPDDLRAFLGVK